MATSVKTARSRVVVGAGAVAAAGVVAGGVLYLNSVSSLSRL